MAMTSKLGNSIQRQRKNTATPSTLESLRGPAHPFQRVRTNLPNLFSRAIWRQALILTLLSAFTLAQSNGSESKPHPLTASQAAELRDYIHSAWKTLTRSKTDCASLIDTKLTTKPALYLPADLPIPAAVQQIESKCGNRVVKLPRVIQKMHDVQVSEIPPGLLYLPNPYVVPGGRFNEMYGWDSYFIVR